MYLFINFSINSSSDFFINIDIFKSLRTTERQAPNRPLKVAILHNEHACSKHPNVPADDICKQQLRMEL